MNSTKNSLFIEIIAALLILLFTYTAISKLSNLSAFQVVLSQSPLIKDASDPVSITIPITELIVSLGLFFPSTRIYGLYASMVLMTLFTGYIGYMIVYTPHLPCSCGGVIRQLSWKQHLLFNTFFLMLSLIGALLHNTRNFFYQPKQGKPKTCINE